MMIPSIHLNGTSKSDLIEQQCDVRRAADALLDALRKAGPNGRDYYPQGTDALRKAQAEYAERYAAVTKIRDDAEVLALAIHDGGWRA